MEDSRSISAGFIRLRCVLSSVQCGGISDRLCQQLGDSVPLSLPVLLQVLALEMNIQRISELRLLLEFVMTNLLLRSQTLHILQGEVK